jgi:uncharacterized MnhB-related membrane protein
MTMMLTIMTAVLCLAILVSGFIAIHVEGDKALPVAILAAGLVSLLASVVYLILAAPDVAMTEAAIGGGLSTFLFFFVLARIRSAEQATGKADGGTSD